MMVAGFELTSTTSYPSARSALHACAPRDRKSTRLNSSHDQISYAVFCLKKKKKEIQIRAMCYTTGRRSIKHETIQITVRLRIINDREMYDIRYDYSENVSKRCTGAEVVGGKVYI